MISQIKKRILEKFNLKHIYSITLLDKKFSSKYTIKTDKGIMFLKTYITKYKDNIQNQKLVENIHLLRHNLYKKNIPVILPLKTNSNKSYFVINKKYAELSNFIQIHPFSGKDKELINASDSLINYHNAVEEREYCTNPWFMKYTNFYSLMKHILGQINNIDIPGLLKKESNTLQIILSSKTNLLLPHLLLHGDYQPFNVGFSKDKLYLFDFESIMIGPRIYDIAIAACSFALSYNKPKVDIKKMKLFVQTYHKKKRLSKEEFDIFLPMIKLFLFKQIYAFSNIQDYNTVDFYLKIFQLINNNQKEFKHDLLLKSKTKIS